MDPVRWVVWSDYLCPWCYNAVHRLDQLQEELGESLELEWRSFLLRPAPAERDLIKFVRYTQSWLRPASEEDAPRFRVWEGTEGPPSHSVPPHLVAKAGSRIDPARFPALHRALLRAYFEESRDITREAVLRELWEGAGYAAHDFETAQDPDLLEETHAQHRQALERGITGVPAVGIAGHEGFVMGAQPVAVYRRWFERLRDGVLEQ